MIRLIKNKLQKTSFLEKTRSSQNVDLSSCPHEESGFQVEIERSLRLEGQNLEIRVQKSSFLTCF